MPTARARPDPVPSPNGGGRSPWRKVAWGGAALLLLLPLMLAMQVTEQQVAWGPGDFALAGTLVVGWDSPSRGRRASRDRTYRVAAGVALATGLALVWLNLAVGLIECGGRSRQPDPWRGAGRGPRRYPSRPPAAPVHGPRAAGDGAGPGGLRPRWRSPPAGAPRPRAGRGTSWSSTGSSRRRGCCRPPCSGTRRGRSLSAGPARTGIFGTNSATLGIDHSWERLMSLAADLDRITIEPGKMGGDPASGACGSRSP